MLADGLEVEALLPLEGEFDGGLPDYCGGGNCTVFECFEGLLGGKGVVDYLEVGSGNVLGVLLRCLQPRSYSFRYFLRFRIEGNNNLLDRYNCNYFGRTQIEVEKRVFGIGDV